MRGAGGGEQNRALSVGEKGLGGGDEPSGFAFASQERSDVDGEWREPVVEGVVDLFGGDRRTAAGDDEKAVDRLGIVDGRTRGRMPSDCQ